MKLSQKHGLPFLFALLIIFSCNPGQTEKGEKVNLPEWNNETRQSANSQPTVQHVVYFWMKDGITAEEEQQFEESLEMLGTCPQIITYRWGKAVPSDREVVDDSFDYSWIVDFANEEDLRAYGTDSIHMEFIAQSEDLWKEVQVYDSTIEN